MGKGLDFTLHPVTKQKKARAFLHAKATYKMVKVRKLKYSALHFISSLWHLSSHYQAFFLVDEQWLFVTLQIS